MFGSGSTSWFSALDSNAKSWISSALKPFQNGVFMGLAGLASVAWAGAKGSPYATSILLSAGIGIGAMAIYSYKKGRLKLKLPQIHFSLDAVLAHLQFKTGLGSNDISNIRDLATRMEDLERGVDACVRANADNFRLLGEQIEAFKKIEKTHFDSASNSFTELNRFTLSQFELLKTSVTALSELVASHHKEMGRSLVTIAGEGAKTNEAVRQLGQVGTQAAISRLETSKGTPASATTPRLQG